MKIVVTGTTRGMGRALAEWYVARGHTVVGCGRTAETIKELRSANPPPHRFEVVDVSQPREVDAWAARVLEDMGPPDLLINNAALMNRPAPLWAVSADEFMRLVSVNLGGTANVIRSFVPAMVKRGAGVIVNVSSGWGQSVSPQFGPYCATKWAIEGMTKALAMELPAGMAAVPLSPGVADTPMLRQVMSERAAGYPKPGAWIETLAPFILQLGPKDNGASVRARA